MMPDPREHKVSCSDYRCEIEITLEIIGGKWKALILSNLHIHQTIRYIEFRRLIPAITQKMLTQQLRELEKYGIIERTVYPSVPPMVEYNLSNEGEQLVPILEQMDQWGKNFVKKYHARNSDET